MQLFDVRSNAVLSVLRIPSGDEVGQVSRPGVLSRCVCDGFDDGLSRGFIDLDDGEHRLTGGVDPDMIADLHV